MKRRLLFLFLAVGVGFGPLAVRAAAETGVPPEQKSAVAALDVMLSGFDTLVTKIDEPGYRQTTLQILKGLKARREVLNRKFDQGFFNDLKLDLYCEYQRTAMWLAPLKIPPPKAEGGESGGREATLATKDRQEVALVTLEWQIKSLENRIGKRPESDPERLAVKSIREHHSALREHFTRAGYEALIAEIDALGQRRRAEAAKAAPVADAK